MVVWGLVAVETPYLLYTLATVPALPHHTGWSLISCGFVLPFAFSLSCVFSPPAVIGLSWYSTLDNHTGTGLSLCILSLLRDPVPQKPPWSICQGVFLLLSWVMSTTNYCSPCWRLVGSSHSEEGSSCCRNVSNCELKLRLFCCIYSYSLFLFQLMNFFKKIQNGLSFWYRLTQVVLKKGH